MRFWLLMARWWGLGGEAAAAALVGGSAVEHL